MSAFSQAQCKKLIEKVLGKNTVVRDTTLMKGLLHWWPNYEYCKSPTLAPDFDCYDDFGLVVEAMKARNFTIVIEYHPNVPEWEVAFVNAQGEPNWECSGPSLPITAARAALAAAKDNYRWPGWGAKRANRR